MNENNVFDNNVDLYEKWFVENNFILDTEIEAIRSLLQPSGEGIEIGVGTGIFSSRLGIKFGVDPSEKMSAKASERGIHVMNAFAEELPIVDESYQFALMVTVDCFLSDITKAFREVNRILSKAGYVIIAFIDKETPLGKIYEQHKYSYHFYKHANFNSSKEIITLLEKVGFEVQEKKQTIYTLENKVQEINDGVGEGVFAIIKAIKR